MLSQHQINMGVKEWITMTCSWKAEIERTALYGKLQYQTTCAIAICRYIYNLRCQQHQPLVIKYFVLGNSLKTCIFQIFSDKACEIGWWGSTEILPSPLTQLLIGFLRHEQAFHMGSSSFSSIMLNGDKSSQDALSAAGIEDSSISVKNKLYSSTYDHTWNYNIDIRALNYNVKLNRSLYFWGFEQHSLEAYCRDVYRKPVKVYSTWG